MIVKPSDLPTAEELEISPALDSIIHWRLDNHEAGPTTDEAIAFGVKHKVSFFQSIREALQSIDRRIHGG